MDAVQPTWPSSALVVGGSRGIGREVVLQLTACGVHCAIGYQSQTESAKATAADAAKVGPEPVLIQGDQGVDPRAFVDQALEALGDCGSVVTTAAPMLLGRMLDVTEGEYRSAMDSQVWGLQELVRAALPSLENASGSIVTVSALGAGMYASYYGALGPAKSALETTVRYLASELGPRGIRINAVSPGVVNNHSAGVDLPDSFAVFQDRAAKRTPLRRLASSAEIASVIVAMLSSAFGFVTGQVVAVDGGYSLIG